MSKFKIEVTDFGKNEAITHSFTSARNRVQFIQNETIGGKKQVYIFLFKKSKDNDSFKNEDIYIFDNYNCIKEICGKSWVDSFLIKFDSYKSAYIIASALRDEIICYTPPEQTMEDMIQFFKSSTKS